MCNCKDLPEAVADILYQNRNFNFSGAFEFHRYFDEISSDDFEPELSQDFEIFKCSYCGQYWYMEFLPEEAPSPSFAIKCRGPGYEPTTDETAAMKEYLNILAHGGFDSGHCRFKSCLNFKLKGRELCHKHISAIW